MPDARERRILDRLPTEARNRLTRLIFENDGLASASRDATDRCSQLRDEIYADQTYLDRRAKEPGRLDGDAGVKTAQSAIQFKQQEIGDLNRANAEREARRRPLSAIINSAFEAIAAVPASKLLQSAKYERQPVRGSHADAVDRVRSRIRSLKERRAEVERAPMPIASLKEAAREQIEALAQRGQPDLSGLIAEGHSIGWPKSSEMAGGTPEDVTLAVFAYVNRDAMIAAVHAQIDREATDDGAMTPAERDAAMKKMDGEIETAERTEAAIIDDAREHGVMIEYCADADPFATLGLSRQFVNAPARQAQPYQTQNVSGQPRHPSAPIHSASLMPEPALRGQV